MQPDEHRSTARVLAVFHFLAFESNNATLTEIAQHLDAPKSSLLPILRTMAEQKFLSYDEISQRYSIGRSTYLVGAAYTNQHGSYRHLIEEMQNIVDQCSEICQLGVLENEQVLYLAKVDSPEPIRLISDIGKQLPAYCTALGKALLSTCSMAELHAYFPANATPLTAHTVRTFDDFMRQIEQVRTTSLICESGETHPDISCIATPILKNNKAIAAISVSVPIFRLTEEKKQQIEALLLHAKANIEPLIAQDDLPFE